MSWVAAGVAVVGTGYSIYNAEQQKKKSREGIAELKKQNMPTFKTAQQIQQEAETAVPRGYTPEQIAVYHQNRAKTLNTLYQKAVSEGGGNLASSIAQYLKGDNINSDLQFAANDANLKQLKQNQFANSVTGQSNNQTNADLHYRLLTEQAYGQAGREGTENEVNSVFSLANVLGNCVDWGDNRNGQKPYHRTNDHHEHWFQNRRKIFHSLVDFCFIKIGNLFQNHICGARFLSHFHHLNHQTGK